MRLLPLLILSLASLAPAVSVQVTAYSLRGITSSQTHTRSGGIALSRDLLRSIPLGSRVRVSGIKGAHCSPPFRTGIFTVNDTMGRGITRTVDIWLPSYTRAVKMGRCKAKLTVLRKGK